MAMVGQQLPDIVEDDRPAVPDTTTAPTTATNPTSLEELVRLFKDEKNKQDDCRKQ